MKPDEQHALLQRYREAVNTPEEKRAIYRLSESGECPRQRRTSVRRGRMKLNEPDFNPAIRTPPAKPGVNSTPPPPPDKPHPATTTPDQNPARVNQNGRRGLKSNAGEKGNPLIY